MRRSSSWRGWYYGWTLVGLLSVAEVTSWGILYYAFTVFLAPMQEEFGWSRGAMTGAYALALVVSGVAGIPFGRWLDRRGPRLLMTVCSLAAVVLVLAWSAVQSLPMLYLIWAGIGITMAGVLYEPAFQAIAVWFRRKRARALTLMTFVGGFASVIYVPLAGWLVQAYGWRTALAVLAVILALGTIPIHALVLRRAPEDLGLRVDGDSGTAPDPARPAQPAEYSARPREALHGATFWLLSAAFWLNTLGSGGMTIHLAPYLTDHGYGAGFAASVMGLVGVLALPGRLIFTPLGERVPRALLTAFIFSMQAVALIVLLSLDGTAGVFLFAVLFGIGFGAITPMRAALVAEYYGPAFYGSIAGVLTLFVTAARAGGPLFAGLAYDAMGGYRPALWAFTILSVLAAISVLMAEQRAQRHTLIAGPSTP